MTPADKVAAVLRVELEPWQRRVLDTMLVLPAGQPLVRPARLVGEAAFRAAWSSWRELRSSVRDES